MFNAQMLISELERKQGVLLLMEIPMSLKPKLPPMEQLNKYDSNYGIDDDWVKICYHIRQDG